MNNWKKAQALKLNSKERWEWYIKAEYGLTIEQHNKMIEASGGLCSICRLKKKLHIDHNHTTGQVRGLLCKNCNYKLLGIIEKNVILAQRAISYLKKWGKK